MQQPPQGEPRVGLPPQGAASAMLACVERWSEELVSSISAATEQRAEELAKAFGRLGEEIAVEVSGLAGRARRFLDRENIIVRRTLALLRLALSLGIAVVMEHPAKVNSSGSRFYQQRAWNDGRKGPPPTTTTPVPATV